MAVAVQNSKGIYNYGTCKYIHHTDESQKPAIHTHSICTIASVFGYIYPCYHLRTCEHVR